MSKPPLWFTLICAMAVFWNAAGLFAVVSDLRLSPADVARLSPTDQAMYAGRPLWSVAASLLAVVGGTLGSIGLLVGHRWSTNILLASSLGVVAQDASLFLMTNGTQRASSLAVVLQTVVLVTASGLVGLAYRANRRGWLR